jgi:hypothetical protein
MSEGANQGSWDHVADDLTTYGRPERIAAWRHGTPYVADPPQNWAGRGCPGITALGAPVPRIVIQPGACDHESTGDYRIGPLKDHSGGPEVTSGYLWTSCE